MATHQRHRIGWGTHLLAYLLFFLFLFLYFDATYGQYCVENDQLQSYTGYCTNCYETMTMGKIKVKQVHIVFDNGLTLSAAKNKFTSNGISEDDLAHMDEYSLTYKYYPGLLPFFNTGTLVSLSGHEDYRIFLRDSDDYFRLLSVIWSVCVWLWGILIFFCLLLPAFFQTKLWNRCLPKLRKLKKNIKQAIIKHKKKRD